MTSNPSDEIDDVLSEVLPDDPSSGTDQEAGPDFTIAQTVSEQNQQHVIDDQIERLSSDLEIPSATVDMAKSLRDQYRTQRGDLVGTALELVATSCLYCACKVTDVPLDPTDFVEAGDPVVTRKTLLRRSKDIAATVGLDPSAFSGSEQYVDRYCGELVVSDVVQERAHEILEQTEHLAGGKSPSGWAAAAVYKASLDCNEKLTQHRIADIANVSEVTIRNRYQEQQEALRETEAPPDDPADVVAQVDAVTSLSDAVREGAYGLLDQARNEGYPVDDDPGVWALAAIRRASELADDPMNWTTLKQFTDHSSQAVQRRRTDLRSLELPPDVSMSR